MEWILIFFVGWAGLEFATMMLEKEEEKEDE